MKYLKILFVIIASVILATGSCLATQDVKVYVNGVRVNEEVHLINDLTYVPLRAVSEYMGANVEWDPVSFSAHVSFSEDDAIAQIVSESSASVVTIVGNYAGGGEAAKYNNPTMHGSGVVYKSNGYIITNAHVVKDIINLTVVLNDGTTLPGNVLFSDEESDLAIVKIDKLGMTPIRFAKKEDIVSGKTAIVIGTPVSLSMRNTVTKGIISGNGVALSDSYYKLIQTDAAINPGNSGGPLLNTKGELIGINSSKFVNINIDNVGFAIPVDTVSYVISQYEKNGCIKKPDLDIVIEESWEAKIGLPTTKGIYVRSSASDKILPGDTINAINGIPVHSVSDWNEAIKSSYNGSAIVITYVRGGVSADIEIKC